MTSTIHRMALTGLCILAAAAPALAQQYARPDATTRLSQFSVTGANTAHEATDETSADDTDYAYTTDKDGELRLSLSSLLSPPSSSNHILRIRAIATGGGGGGMQRNRIDVELRDGGTRIGQWKDRDVQTYYTNITLTLTQSEAGNISDYSNLEVRFKIADLDANEIRITWVEFEAPAPPVTLPVLSAPTFTTVTPTGATLGATVTGTALTARGTIWNTTGTGLTLPHVNSLPEGGLASGAFAHARTALPIATRIWFVGYATNSAGTAYSPLGTFYTEAAPPGMPTFTNVKSDRMTINWTSLPPSTPNVLVVMKQGAAVDTLPVDHVTYTPNAVFRTGTQLGAGNYVVYAGPANTVTVTGLTAGATYHVALVGYAGIPAMESYNTLAPPIGSQAAAQAISLPTLSAPTFSAIDVQSATLGATVDSAGNGTITARGVVWDTTPAPTANAVPEGATTTGAFTLAVTALPAGTRVYFRGYATNESGTGYSSESSFFTEPYAATNVVTTNVTTTSMRVMWTAGSGDGAVVLVKRDVAVDAAPADGTSYAAGAAFGSGAQIGTGNFVVHAGSGTQVDVTGLSPAASYSIAVYEYVGTGVGASGVNYQQDAPATGAVTTQSGPPGLTASTATSVTGVTAQIGATIDSDGGSAITERGTVWNTTGAPITENGAAEGGTAVGAFSHERTSLPSGTRVWYRGYAVNGFGTAYSPSASFYTEPTTATNVVFSNVGPRTMRIAWTAGGGDGALVVVRSGAAVDGTPVDGVEHAASSVFGAGAVLGTGGFVVHRGGGSQVDVSGLDPQTTYHVAVYEYAGSGSGVSGVNYAQSAPATGQQTTAAPIDLPLVSAPTVAGVGATTATLGASVDSAGGAAITAIGTVWNATGAPIVENAQATGGTTPGVFTQSRSALPQGVRVWFRGYATNLGGTGYSRDSWFYTEPTQASGVTASEVRAIDAKLSWTAGGGDGVIVLAGASGPIAGSPVDGVVYTGGGFGNGSQIGGDFVVYVGPANSIRLTGLLQNVTFDVAVFEYAGSGVGPSGINYRQASPTTTSFTTGTATTHNAMHGVNCVQCHSVFSNYVPRDTDQATACKQCHNATGAASNMAEVALHKVGGGTTIVDCGQCHEVHNSSRYSFDTTDTHTGGVTARNLKFIRWDVTKYQPQALEPALFQSRPSQFAFFSGNTPYNGVCQTCHTKTGNHTNDGYDDTSGPNGATADMNHQQGTDCTTCHMHASGFRPGGDDCLSCHRSGGSSQYDVATDFARTSHHVMGGAVTNDDCGVCHQEAEDVWVHADGSIDLRAPDGGAVIRVAMPLTRNRASATLEADVLTVQNDFCLKCHDSDGATVTKFSADARRPFSSADRVAPDVSAQLDPLQSTFHHPVKQAGINPYTTSTGTNGNKVTMVSPWNQASGTHDVITCFDCHETTGHGSSKQRMLLDAIDFDTMVATTTKNGLPSGMGSSVETFCSRCHKSSVYVTTRNPQQAGSLFDEHGQGKRPHSASGGNGLGCMGCHAGVTNLGGISDNGALAGNLHGSTFTWPSDAASSARGTTTDYFLLGGFLNGWYYDSNTNKASCWGGLCHHNSGSGENYNR